MRGDDDVGDGDRFQSRGEDRRREQYQEDNFGGDRRGQEEEPIRKSKTSRLGDDYQYFDNSFESKGYGNK